MDNPPVSAAMLSTVPRSTQGVARSALQPHSSRARRISTQLDTPEVTAARQITPNCTPLSQFGQSIPMAATMAVDAFRMMIAVWQR